MVTLSRISDGNLKKLELEGLSSDEKPIKEFRRRKIANGSTFLCIDTLDIYLYDAEHETWVLIKGNSGSWGGDGVGDIINIDPELAEYYGVAKNNIRKSIEIKGVSIDDADSLNDYAEKILDISPDIKPTETLPLQTILTIQDLQETDGIKLTWKDVSASGYLIVRKQDTPPDTTADGDVIYDGKELTFIDTKAKRGNLYYYRIFPYNSSKQYQSTEQGSIVYVEYKDRTGQKQISDLEVDDIIAFGEYDGVYLKWRIVDTLNKEDGYFTVMSDSSIGCQFDAAENDSDTPNPDADRRAGGNNRWLYSNARQFLNSDKAANQWFVKQHQYDTQPNISTRNAFLYDFTDFEKDIIVPKNNLCNLANVDGGGQESVIDHIFIPSSYAIGAEITQPLDDEHIYEKFASDPDSRKRENTYFTRSIPKGGKSSVVTYILPSSGSANGISCNIQYNVYPCCLLPISAYIEWDDNMQLYKFSDDNQREYGDVESK